MKKQFKIIIVISITTVVVVLSTFSIVQSFKRKDNAYYYLPITRSHYLFKEYNNLKFNVYSNHQQDEYLQKDKIISSYIKDLHTNDYYEVIIKNIVEKEAEIRFENRFFYQYILTIEFPIRTYQQMQLREAKLILNFDCDEKREFNMGSIILDNDENISFFHLSNLKGVVNEINEIQTLKGVCLTLNKDFDENVRIIKIESLDNRVKAKEDGFFLIQDTSFDNEISIQTLVESDYCQGFVPYPSVITDNKINILIELDYEEIQMITTMGFKITYERNNIEYKQYVMPFQYFNSSSKEVDKIVYDSNNY